METIQLLKDYFFTFLITAGLAIATTWTFTEIYRVNPLKQKIEDFKEQTAKYEQYINELNTSLKSNRKQVDELLAALDVYRKQVDQLLENDKTYRSNSEVYKSEIKQYQDAIESWKKHSSALQKTVNSHETNCSILSKVHQLDERKISVDWYSRQEGYAQQAYVTWYRESQELQARILDLQKNLVCIPK